MIQECINLARKLRKGEIDISEFQYLEQIDEKEDESYDLNERRRFKILLGMRFDPSEQDESLLKILIKQEIEMNSNSVSRSGLASLELNSFLLSRFRNLENVWLFLEAKRANFDAHCGYDRQYIISAGIEETFAYVNSSQNELKELFYEYMEASPELCDIKEKDLDHWFSSMTSQYDIKKDFASLDDQIWMAELIGEEEILREKIIEWKNLVKDWDSDNCWFLSSYAQTLQNLEWEIFANEQLFILALNDWNKASCLQTLSKLYLQSGRPEISWKKICDAIVCLENIEDWRNVNLGRFLVENSFDIFLHFKDPKNSLGKEAYEWAIEQMKYTNLKDVSWNLLEKAGTCAIQIGDPEIGTELLMILEKMKKEFADAFPHDYSE